MANVVDYFGIFEVNPTLREHFASGILCKTWAERYPNLFDTQDLELAFHQPANHFYEWLAAVMIYETTGFLSLVEKYQFPKHSHKHDLFCRLADQQVVDLILNSQKHYHVQSPDLLAYAPDLSNYFFCEVKGISDRIRDEQLVFFEELRKVSKKRVCFIKFVPFLLNKQQNLSKLLDETGECV